tara:strand:+ start:6682 stop:7164 length:483 start_codon:yes stop_codon:yes gene_type:complete
MRLNKVKAFTLVSTFFLFAISCGDGTSPYFVEDDFSTVPDPYSTVGITPDTSDSGLITYKLASGSGPFTVNIIDDVLVYYTGRKTNGDVFDSSFKNGSTSSTQLTVTGVIEGFKEGLLGMKEGDKKILVIPPSLGYGNSSGSTLQNDTLIFDIQLDLIIK